MMSLYADIRTNKSYTLAVDSGHEIYVEESGNMQGLPVLVVHDGPGYGSERHLRQYFDPEQYRIIQFDQRGCGASTPQAELKANDTKHILKDMETLRKHLELDHWMLFAGGWGATLALLYTIAHAKHVASLVLFNVFLCRPKDIDWIYDSGLPRMLYDHWLKFNNFLPTVERKALLQGYYKRLTSQNELARMAAVKSWNAWWEHCTGRQQKLKRHRTSMSKAEAKRHLLALAPAKIACHFMVNGGFMPENGLLNEVNALQEVPTVIVHGRFNMIYPLEQAWVLHQALSESELHVVNTSSSELDTEMVDVLIRTTQQMAARYRH